MAGPTPRATNTKSVDRTWKSAVVAADPDFEALKRREPEYEFSNGKVFSANRATRFPYDQDV
jgi:hypothetical protein